MTSLDRAPLQECRSALIWGFHRSAPKVVLTDKGYVNAARENLIEGVHLDEFEADLRQGDGNELETKFRAAHSSSALAVNVFAPFKANSAHLQLPGSYDFTSLSFERKCPHGLAGRRSPNLDVLANGPNGVVAVESKCLEPLTPHVAKFALAYESEIRDQRRQTVWFEEMLRLVKAPTSYRWLDAAQLVKHAFGLAYTFPEQPVTLLYLYWEPSNPEKYPYFAAHRAEVARFAASVSQDRLGFVAMSYPELWKMWESHSKSKVLAPHIQRLRERYLVGV